MEVDAVLESLVFEANEGDTGVFRAALSFEVFEEGGSSIDSQGDVGEGPIFSDLGLFDFFFEEDLLFSEGAVGGEGRFDFAEGEEGDAGVVFDAGAVLIEGGAGAGGEGTALVDCLGEGGGDAVDEEVGVESAADVVGSIGGSTGEAEGGEEVFTGGLGVLGGCDEVGAGGDEVGAPFDELGGETDGDFFREEGEVVGGGDGGGGVTAKEDFEVAGRVVAVELADAEGALGRGDVVACELDIDGAEGGGFVASFDDGEGLFV